MKKIVITAVILFACAMPAITHAELEMAIWPPQPVTSPNGKWQSEITPTANPAQWKVTVFALDKQHKKSRVAWSRVFDFQNKGGNRFHAGYVSPNGRAVVYTAPYSPNWAIATIVQPKCIKQITSKDVVLEANHSKANIIMSSPAQWLMKQTATTQVVSFAKHMQQVRFHTLSGEYLHSLDCQRDNIK